MVADNIDNVVVGRVDDVALKVAGRALERGERGRAVAPRARRDGDDAAK